MSEGVQPPTPDPADDWSPDEEAAVLLAAETCQTPTGALGCGGKHWHQIRRRKAANPAFLEAWNEARARYVDGLELVYHARARDGWQETEIVETFDESGKPSPKERRTRSKWDPRLAQSVLAAQRPEVWGKREKVEHTVGGGGVNIILPQAEGPAKDVHPKEDEEGAS